MTAKFLGDITSVEEYTDKKWEVKKNYTKVGALFQNEKGVYSVKILGSFLPVFKKEENQ